MPFQKVNLDPSASGSSGLARGVYRTTSDTMAECTAEGYFDEAWALLRGVKAMLIIASDGDAEYRLDVIPSQVTLTKLFASSASGELAETALQPSAIGTSIQAFSANLGQLAAASALAITAAIGVPNFSMPLDIEPVGIYITKAGTDDTGDDVMHGTTEASAFLTFNAAITHVKKYYKFEGRLALVEFRHSGDAWGGLNIGSSLDAGTDFFPFGVCITSIDNANRARFDGITCGSWLPVYVKVRQVESSYFSVVRRNVMEINDVGVIAGTVVPYCFRVGSYAHMYILGSVVVHDLVAFSSGFMYLTDHAFLSLENGDTDPPFPQFVLTGQGNITSPGKYRAVLGSEVYCPTNSYAMLTYATTYHVDAYSLSTQTQQGIDLSKNTGLGGPVVTKSGNTAAGYRISADGYVVQWGTATVTDAAASAVTDNMVEITIPIAMVSITYAPFLRWNNPNVLVTKGSTTSTSTKFTISVRNFAASLQSATVGWEVHGYMA